jgi:hypothetical protein
MANSTAIRFEVFMAMTMENELSHSEMSVLTRATLRNIPDDGILHLLSCFNTISTCAHFNLYTLQPVHETHQILVCAVWMFHSRV